MALVFACIVFASCAYTVIRVRVRTNAYRARQWSPLSLSLNACRTLMFAWCQTSFIAIRKPLHNLMYLKKLSKCAERFIVLDNFSSCLLRIAYTVVVDAATDYCQSFVWFNFIARIATRTYEFCSSCCLNIRFCRRAGLHARISIVKFFDT